MKRIVGYLTQYGKEVDKRTLLFSVVFITIAIFLNYHYHIEKNIRETSELQQYTSWLLIFSAAFFIPYLFQKIFYKKSIFIDKRLVLLMIAAPAIFAWKMSGNVYFPISNHADENAYWNQVIYWPVKLLIVTTALWLLWKIFDRQGNFYGLHINDLQLKPYLIMLLLMIPLITIASTQPDFLALYPKMKHMSFIASTNNLLYKLLYELSYGTDFFTIELFFRGFLILAFAKWVGKDAILPMALFYCTIHFGKPIGECISSFFGGLILGVITYHTNTIYGGLIVHLGIAWMMEIGGYLGNLVHG